MADVSINTVAKLLVDVGTAAAGFHYRAVRNVKVHGLQCDEVWCSVGVKAKNVTLEQKSMGRGGRLDLDGNRRGHKSCA
ncbi:hypothetical protein ACPOL_6538 [Acidisarcina polymorpha]|uniref:Uncharacterized protein n=1 Tax=Acidisarcina polymorpha TaxID=2211140 RepID=A0A2Z5G9T0_9BACT|nr:hypothetical protein ACPOL_6538 [Acidisarcina polymorpha]